VSREDWYFCPVCAASSHGDGPCYSCKSPIPEKYRNLSLGQTLDLDDTWKEKQLIRRHGDTAAIRQFGMSLTDANRRHRDGRIGREEWSQLRGQIANELDRYVRGKETLSEGNTGWEAACPNCGKPVTNRRATSCPHCEVSFQQVVCPKCGRATPKAIRTCCSCHTVLPAVFREMTDDDAVELFQTEQMIAALESEPTRSASNNLLLAGLQLRRGVLMREIDENAFDEGLKHAQVKFTAHQQKSGCFGAVLICALAVAAAWIAH
jgi:hypothetical protein